MPGKHSPCSHRSREALLCEPLSIVLSSFRLANGYLRDTFTGAYASEYLRQKTEGRWDIESAVLRANQASAFIVGHPGCQEGIPWADEIDKLEGSLGEKFENLTVSGKAVQPASSIDEVK